MKLKFWTEKLRGCKPPLNPRQSPWLLSQQSYYSNSRSSFDCGETETESNNFNIPTSGISRPLSEILKELNKKVPDSLVRQRLEDGFSIKYIPWHIVNRVMNLHAPEWSGEVRNITYSADGKSVSVVYRVTLYGTDAEILVKTSPSRMMIWTYLTSMVKLNEFTSTFRESTGTASTDDDGYGDPVQKAEAMAFRRACARFGLGLHLYHEDMS